MCELDVASLNLIDGSANTINPGYNILGEFRHHEIKTWMNHDGYLLIVAILDNKYSYWTSVTKVEERENNAAIFDYISRVDEENTKNFVGYYWLENAGHFLEKKSFEHLKDARGRIDLSKWYESSFVLSAEDGSIKLASGYGLSKECFEERGTYMAGDVLGLFHDLRKKCLFREASGVYGKVLDNYLQILEQEKEDPLYYEEIESLTKIIVDESYMFLSPNVELRNKYLSVCELRYMRYCFYMSAIR